jgi:hypothetical protein
MALLKYGDRVRESTATEGSADYILEGVLDVLENSFVGEIGAGNWCYYCCEGLDDWEIGYGQLSASPNTLTRDTIFASSNNNLKVPWGVGTRTIFNTATAQALDHIAGFAINESSISFNRTKFVAIDAQDTFEFIYLRGSLEIRVDGLVLTEDQYSATDGLWFILNTPCTVGQVVEAMSIGQYTTTHTDLSTTVPTGQIFKSGIFLNDVWRNESGSADAIATNCLRASSVSGIDGDAVNLNGTDSTITLTDFGLDHSTDFTISLWMKTSSTLADAVLLSNQSTDDADGYLLVRTTAAGNLEVAILDGSVVEQTITYAIAIDSSYHVAITYDGTDLNLWVDGVEGTPLTTTVKTTTVTNDLAIGGRLYPTPSEYCEGTVYGINIYDSCLLDAEIALIYSEPNAPDTTTLDAIVVPGGSVATQEDIIAMVIALG